MADRPRLAVVHRGTFSGSTPNLVDALATRADVHAIDVLPWARDVRLAPARLSATIASGRLATGADWSRTVPWSKAVARRVDAELRRHRPDAVLVVQSYPLLREPGGPYAVYTDRTAIEGQRIDPRFRTPTPPDWLALEAETLRGAARVLTFGGSAARSAMDDYGIPEERVEVVGTGPNAPPHPPRDRARCTRLLFVGVEWERKGGEILLQALPLVRARLPDVELTIVGASPAPVPARVTVLGRIGAAAVAAAQHQADLHVMPSLAEPYGIVHAEAILSGLPTIGSTVGSQPEIIGAAGRVVPPGDAPALAHTIIEVAEHYDDVVAATLARREDMQDRWSWPTVAGRILDGLGLGSG
jgi:glycogen synthase